MPAAVRERVRAVVAVAGTATSVAAIDAGVEPYDPVRVEGRDRAGLPPVGHLR